MRVSMACHGPGACQLLDIQGLHGGEVLQGSGKDLGPVVADLVGAAACEVD
jgi:hypothetical protein